MISKKKKPLPEGCFVSESRDILRFLQLGKVYDWGNNIIYRQLGEFATSFEKHTSESEIESID